MMVQEVKQELANPTQTVRDILDLSQPEETLREFLRLVVLHLEKA